MQRNTESFEGTVPDSTQPQGTSAQRGCFSHAGQPSGDGRADSPRNTPLDPGENTSQAERAVMHPEHSDAEWRYYHTAWHS